LGALFVLAAPLAPAFAAEPPGTPDTETLNRLQARFEGGRRARLATLGGERILTSPVFTLDGVRSSDLTLTLWSEIERIDARGGRPKTGAIIGGIAGLGFGLFVGFASALGGESGNGAREFVGATLLWTGIGAVGGAAVGAMALPGGWAQVYPEKQSGSSWGLQKRK
jgi:hypothetical protein